LRETTSPAQGVIWRGRSRCDEHLGDFVAKAMLRLLLQEAN
jgi:hypothetical protein